MKKLLLFLVTVAAATTSFAQYVFKGFDLEINGSTDPKNMVVMKNKLYFDAADNATNHSLWVTDGSLAGTQLVKDINPGIASADILYPVSVNERLFFSADDGINGAELWISDGTTTGTVLVKDINPGLTASNPTYLTAYNNKVYFSAVTPGYGNELWVSDGTDTGTKMLTDINPGTAASNPGFFYVSYGKLYFSATDPVNGNEIWVTDGTVAGTYMVKDIYSGTGNSYPAAFTACNGKTFFTADSGPANGQELWITDGTDTGTHMVKDINPMAAPGFMGAAMGVYNNKVYLAGNDPVNGIELYVSDGTAAGTQLVKDINPSGDGYPKYFCINNNKLYFAAYTPAAGYELWVTDGSSFGTYMVKDIFTGTTSSDPRNLTPYRGHLIFSALAINSDRQVFTSDGTPGGTIPLNPVFSTKANPINETTPFVAYDSALYFQANYTAIGNELWSLKDTTGLGITKSANNISATLYPNPGDGNFTIELKNNNFKDGSVSVYNMLGELVYKSQITNSKFQISLQQPKGIYLVKLQLDDALMTKRVVVE